MTPAALRIDAATEADIPVILALIRALADYERMTADVVASEATLQASLFGPRPSAEVVIARIGAAPVGFAVWFHTYSTFLGRRGLYLEDLFVVPASRRRGVGRALLAHLAAIAIARDCGRMEWSVLDWNAPAIVFYERLGARPMAEWTVYRLTGDALSNLAARSSTQHDPETHG
jgi:GNAT superfamily N-acetyltransferase